MNKLWTSILTVAICISAASFVYAESTNGKKNCDELLNQANVTPDLYSAILDCELNEDDETFAAAGPGGGGGDLGFPLITGDDIPLNPTDPTDPSEPEAKDCTGGGRCDNNQGTFGFSI
jgi:hypothetical protein